MSFEEVYKLTDTISHSTAFRQDEAESLYSLLNALPNKAKLVEIGVQFGRSFSIMLQVGKVKEFEVTAIDNFCEENGNFIYTEFVNNMRKTGYKFNMFREDSSLAHILIDDNSIDLLHIDGDHTYNGVRADILNYLGKVKVGGYVCFHDYGRDSLVGVTEAVDDFMGDLEDISHTYTFKVFRKK